MKYMILVIAVSLLVFQIVLTIRDIKRMRSPDKKKKEVSENEDKTP